MFTSSNAVKTQGMALMFDDKLSEVMHDDLFRDPMMTSIFLHYLEVDRGEEQFPMG